MFHWRAPGAVLLPLLLSVLSWGCSGVLQAITDSSSRPTARVSGVQLRDLGLSGLTLVFDVEIQNNAPASLPLLGLDYRLRSAGQPFLSGRSEALGSVEAMSARTVSLPARVEFAGLLQVLSSLRPGQVLPYEADLTLSVQLPAVGPLELPLGTKGRIPIPAVPKVSVGGIRWETLSLQEARGSLDLTLTSQNDFPLDLTNLSYDLALGGVSMLQGQTPRSQTLESGEPSRLTIPIALSPVQLGLSAFNILTGSAADYSLEGKLDVGTPFGALDMPFVDAGRTALGAP